MSKKITARSHSRVLSRVGVGSVKKQKKWGVIITFVLSTFFAILLAIAGYWSYGFLQAKPQKSLSDEAKSKLMITRDDLTSTLVVLDDNGQSKILGAWYIVKNLRSGFVVVYSIPPRVYMREYLNRISEYVSVGDLKFVGDTISQPRKIEYAVWQLGNLTGMTPDSYIWFDSNSLTAFSHMFGDVSEFEKSNYSSLYIEGDLMTEPSFTINSVFDKFSFLKLVMNQNEYKHLIQGISTNLSLADLLIKIDELKTTLNSSQLHMVDLGQLWATTASKTSSGLDINLVNYSQVDQKLSEIVKNLKGRDIEREQVKIEVYNASEIEGLASRYFRKFQNSGVDVVRYENAPSPQDHTVVYVPKPETFPKSLEVVKKLIVVPSTTVHSRPDFMTTADIVVVLGKDMEVEAVWK
ncbi:LytR C-terminal domain-containing protein [bacterium]|nr:LytR C-terminal domain-containing protein [bacterium]